MTAFSRRSGRDTPLLCCFFFFVLGVSIFFPFVNCSVCLLLSFFRKALSPSVLKEHLHGADKWQPRAHPRQCDEVPWPHALGKEYSTSSCHSGFHFYGFGVGWVAILFSRAIEGERQPKLHLPAPHLSPSLSHPAKSNADEGFQDDNKGNWQLNRQLKASLKPSNTLIRVLGG